MAARTSSHGSALRDIAIVVVFFAVNIGIPRYLKSVKSSTRKRKHKQTVPADVVPTANSVSTSGPLSTTNSVPTTDAVPTLSSVPTANSVPTVDSAPTEDPVPTANLVLTTNPVRPAHARGPHTFENFVRLPVEIREIIYEYAMRSDGVFDFPTHAVPCGKLRVHQGLNEGVPAVCFTSSVENSVAMGVFIRSSTFRLFLEPDAGLMSAWLSLINDDLGFRSIRRVEICYDVANHFSSFTRSFELLQRCPGLRDLAIVIPLEELNSITYNAARRPMSKRPLTATELLTKFQIGGILECSSLRNVKCSISSKYTFHFASRLPLYIELTKVLEWVMRAFENRYGRTIESAIDISNNDGKVLSRLWKVKRLDG